jgi:hypothetical protein
VGYEVFVEAASLGGVSQSEEAAPVERAAIGRREDESRPSAGAFDAK